MVVSPETPDTEPRGRNPLWTGFHRVGSSTSRPSVSWKGVSMTVGEWSIVGNSRDTDACPDEFLR